MWITVDNFLPCVEKNVCLWIKAIFFHKKSVFLFVIIHFFVFGKKLSTKNRFKKVLEN